MPTPIPPKHYSQQAQTKSSRAAAKPNPFLFSVVDMLTSHTQAWQGTAIDRHAELIVRVRALSSKGHVLDWGRRKTRLTSLGVALGGVLGRRALGHVLPALCCHVSWLPAASCMKPWQWFGREAFSSESSKPVCETHQA